MFPLTPLQIEDCRLSTREIVDLHNKLAEALTRVRDQLPMVWDDDDVQQRWLRLYTDTRKLVGRTHYRVGFIGGSQAGKSSTFNSVLGFIENDDESPAKGGTGKATTATTTRLRRIHSSEDAKPRCSSRYMTRRQVNKRLKSLLAEFGIESLGAWPDDGGISHLEELLRQAKIALESAEQSAASTERQSTDDVSLLGSQATPDDLKYLIKYVNCMLACDASGVPAFERLVSDPAKEFAFPYQDRVNYINHQSSNETHDQLLQREVEIEFPTDKISDKLEMIDLPGLDARLIVDTVLTTEFITEELDASVIFLRSDQLAPNSFFKVMSLFKKHFRNQISERVWLVVTKADGLSGDHLPAVPGKDSVFDTLANSLQSTDIPYEHTYFAANPFFTSYLKAKDRGDADPNSRSMGWGRDHNIEFSADQPSLPNHWASNSPTLREAFSRIFEAGGIPAIRHLLQETIAAKVQARVRKSCESDLKEIAKNVAQVVEAMKTLMSNDPSMLIHAAEWNARIGEARTAVLLDFELFTEPTRELKEHLTEQFERICPKTLRKKPFELPGLYEAHAKSLCVSAKQQFRQKIYGAIFDRVSGLLSKQALPQDVPIWSYKNAYDWWIDQKPTAENDWQVAEKASIQPLIDSIAANDLFPTQHLEKFLNIDEYRLLMAEKIRVFSLQAVHATLVYLDAKLAEAEDQLTLIQKGTESSTEFGSVQLPLQEIDEISNELRMLTDEGILSRKKESSDPVSEPPSSSPAPESDASRGESDASTDPNESDDEFQVAMDPQDASNPAALPAEEDGGWDSDPGGVADDEDDDWGVPEPESLDSSAQTTPETHVANGESNAPETKPSSVQASTQDESEEDQEELF